jgi:hypothetical protein
VGGTTNHHFFDEFTDLVYRITSFGGCGECILCMYSMLENILKYLVFKFKFRFDLVIVIHGMRNYDEGMEHSRV